MGGRCAFLVVLAALLLPSSQASAHNQTTTRAGVPLAWTTSCMHWTLTEQEVENANFGDPVQPLLTFEDLREAVRASFAVWEEVEGSYFYFHESDPGHCLDIGHHSGSGNANRVFFRSTGWIDPDAPWREEGFIALTSVFFDTETGEIFDADIEVNAEFFELTTTLENPRTDIQNALAHEVGHMLGLDHSEFSDATMYRSARDGETSKRDLSEDDIAGIISIYPLASDPSDCQPPRGGLDEDCDTATWCDDEVDGVAPECGFGELVCCCEEAGGLGRCRWAEAGSCLSEGRHSVLQIDRDVACSDDGPDRSHLCCCSTVEIEAGARSYYETTCSWEPYCQRPVTEASQDVTEEVLCGTRPSTNGDCGCMSPGRVRRPMDQLLVLLLSWLW